MTAELQVMPARCGRAVRLAKGQAVQIINTHGQQVVGTWCFNADDLPEFMSMEHLYASLQQGIFTAKGDGLATNRRRPILMLKEDTSPGRHDTIIGRVVDGHAPTACLTGGGNLALHQFCSGLLKAILAIKETGYGRDKQRRVQACVLRGVVTRVLRGVWY